MNKLEEYRKAWLSQTFMAIEKSLDDNDVITALENLFDAAIALDLPVKFNKWYEIMSYKYVHVEKFNEIYPDLMKDEKFKSHEELYQYWIDNIYTQ